MELFFTASLVVIVIGILAGIFVPGVWVFFMTSLYLGGLFYFNNLHRPGWNHKEHVTVAIYFSLISLFTAVMLVTKLLLLPKKKRTGDKK